MPAGTSDRHVASARCSDLAGFLGGRYLTVAGAHRRHPASGRQASPRPAYTWSRNWLGPGVTAPLRRPVAPRGRSRMGRGWWASHHRRGLPRSASVSLAVVCAVTAVLFVACMSGPGTSASPEYCNGISAEVGGCASDAPSFAGVTCDDVATEWGRQVDQGLVAIIEGQAVVDGQAKSARAHKAIVLPSLLAAAHLQALGLRCDVEDFATAAESELSYQVREGVGGILYDGDPAATYADWRAEVTRALSVVAGS
jgi:hypothetical protein